MCESCVRRFGCRFENFRPMNGSPEYCVDFVQEPDPPSDEFEGFFEDPFDQLDKKKKNGRMKV